MKQLILASLIVLAACSPADKTDPPIVVNSNPGCAQIGGEYEANEYRDGAACGWESEEANYVMRIEQTGCNVTVFLENDQQATGTVGDSAVSVDMSFTEDGGTFTATSQPLSINNDTIQGTLVFKYESEEEPMMCDFEVTITATKIAGTNNTNNINNVNNISSLTLDQRVVGAWGASGSCNDADIQAGLFLCPGGRVRGARTLGNFDFLVCGTFTTTEPDIVTGQERFIAVADPNDPANNDVVEVSYTYDSDADQLIWNGPCAVPLARLEGGTTEADCESATCSDGGSGPVDCGTDCDCGRCNYCESGVCRYGGEGPFGCYRGCGE